MVLDSPQDSLKAKPGGLLVRTKGRECFSKQWPILPGSGGAKNVEFSLELSEHFGT